MKKTWHTVFLILLICLDAALLLLPLLPGYRALFDIGPYPGRPPAFRFLKLAGYALFFPLTAYGCGRLLARCIAALGYHFTIWRLFPPAELLELAPHGVFRDLELLAD